jgi:hypothetical protein
MDVEDIPKYKMREAQIMETIQSTASHDVTSHCKTSYKGSNQKPATLR